MITYIDLCFLKLNIGNKYGLCLVLKNVWVYLSKYVLFFSNTILFLFVIDRYTL
jgi:hypothetical protein